MKEYIYIQVTLSLVSEISPPFKDKKKNKWEGIAKKVENFQENVIVNHSLRYNYFLSLNFKTAICLFIFRTWSISAQAQMKSKIRRKNIQNTLSRQTY